MKPVPSHSCCTSAFEIRFASLFVPGRAFCFPCDAYGHVDIDALPAGLKNNYLFARAMVGKDFAAPCVCRH